MADLGFYNFVQGALAAGKSKEEIGATLVRNGLNQTAIDEVFAAVEHGKKPGPNRPLTKKVSIGSGIIALTFATLLLAFIPIYMVVTGRLVASSAVPQTTDLHCGDADSCVSADLDAIKSQASLLHSLSSSYASLCVDGVVNTQAASGASPQATNINAALRNAVNAIQQARGKSSQGDAGIKCASTDSRYYISATLSASSSAQYYCLDSRGVATTSAPNSGTTFCGSDLTTF